MKKFIWQYNKVSHTALVLMVIYCTHLFAFQVLLENHWQFFSLASSTNGHKSDYILLMVKHQVVKEQNEKGASLPFIPSKNIVTPILRYPLLCSAGIMPQRLPEDSYKLYRLIKILRI